MYICAYQYLLKLHLLGVSHLAIIAQLLARLRNVVLGRGWRDRFLGSAARARDALRPRAVGTQQAAYGHLAAVERLDGEGGVGAVEREVEVGLLVRVEGAGEEGVGARRRKGHLGADLLRAE